MTMGQPQSPEEAVMTSVQRTPDDPDIARRRAGRFLLLVLGAVALVAIVAGVLAATRREPVYDRGTPEGVVQTYLAAVVEDHHDEAASFLAPESRCSVADLDRSHLPDGIRVVLRSVEVDQNSARVEVDVTSPSGDLIGSPETSVRYTFHLTRSAGPWRLTGEPWPMSGCGKAA
jgi:hypothetical protein